MPSVLDGLSDVKEVKRANSKKEGSLAVLYDLTWRSQRPESVFVSQNVIRDDETRSDAQVPEVMTALTWTVGGEVPSILESFQSRAILVRDEYRSVLHTIWKFFGKPGGVGAGYASKDSISDCTLFPPYNPFMGLHIDREGMSQRPGVVVTGMPGIGKSMFLLYVLALRLLARQTTVVQYKPGQFFVFDETGVYSSEDKNAEFFSLPYHTWFLVDSNEDNHVPPTSFLEACLASPRKVVMAASPRSDRFTFIDKFRRFGIIWMQPFTLAEYISGRHFQLVEPLRTEKQLETFFYQYGPSARTAYLHAAEPEEHEAAIIKELYHVKWESIQRTVLSLTSGYFETEFTHHVLVARPRYNNPFDFYIEFATKSLAALVIKFFLTFEQQKAMELYRYFLKSPKARACAGGLLEVIALTAFTEGGQWIIHPMKELPVRSTNQSYSHWGAMDVPAPPFTLFIGHNNHMVQIIAGKHADFPPTEFTRPVRYDYDPDAEVPEKVSALYVPEADNQPSFDAFIYEPRNKHLVIFQVTVKVETHDVKSKGLDWLHVDSIDLVVVSDSKGGTDVCVPLTHAHKIRNVYRLVF